MVFDEFVTEFALSIFEQVLRITFNAEMLKAHQLTAEELVKVIRLRTKGFTVQVKESEALFKPKESGEHIKELYNIKEKIRKVVVQGVKGLRQVLPVKRGEEYIVLTSGTNLKEVLEMKEVDPVRTFSNDLYETQAVLGIEAARQAMINEVSKVIDAQGLNINIRHIMLVADTMCVSGALRGVTRYGVVSEKASVLARASFETPIKHLTNAALAGEVDNLTSVVENVMINQPVPLGTGLPGLVVKMK